MQVFKDVLTPEQRLREYLDLEPSIRQMAQKLMLYPSAFPEGIKISDPNMNYKIVMLCDEQGVYGYVETDHGRKGLNDLEAIIGQTQVHFMAQPGAIRLLANAVVKLGKKHTFIVDGKELVMTPGENNQIKITFEKWDDAL